MHLLARETHGLEEGAAVDLGHSRADLVLLSFADSDLAAAAASWEAMGAARPSLRLVNLARLRHPLSVDLFVESVVGQARCVAARLLGGADYWTYGAEEVAAACRAGKIPLALLPGERRSDSRLAALSTMEAGALARLDACFAAGGVANLRIALGLMAHLAGLVPDAGEVAEPVEAWGEFPLQAASGPTAALVFYRSHLLAGDTAPVAALAAALASRGLAPRALYVDSLKSVATAAGVATTLLAWQPAVVVNLTGFSARGEAGSPLDAAGVPVLQAVLAGSGRGAWEAAQSGLSQADLAMQVALPELDGRLLTTAIAFKEAAASLPELEFAPTRLLPDPDGVALAADRAAGWARLAGTPRAARRLAIILSDYPGVGLESGQEGHAVGLDSFASLDALLARLREAGYEIDAVPDDLPRRLCKPAEAVTLPLADYERRFADLPAAFREAVTQAWGAPCSGFPIRHLRCGNIVVAIEPDRGAGEDRRARYHDPRLPPCHAYVAFRLWLREVDAVVHLGTHGALEWLPGKAVALSAACAPAALARGTPVIYPFIVSNPGEAAAAKRRLGAVTIGHLTPPLRNAALRGEAAALERLIDEYAAADGLDRRRTALLRRDIVARAAACGLLDEAAAPPDAPESEQLARLDAYLCDVKEMQIRDGLHVFGESPPPDRRAALLDALRRSCPAVPEARLAADLDASAAAERAALLAALDGRFVQPGPAGAPSRGRADVLPTGRNLFAIDPRAVPTRSAVALAEPAAEELLRRHSQERGEPMRALVLDIWGSTTIRTGGEDLALALVLLGARPLWDDGSSRVSGVEILPLALLDRPRVDVTLRISGLFRDAFPGQIALFDRAVAAVAARDEAAEWNPLAGCASPSRIFGALPGAYGTGAERMLVHGADRAAIAEAYLAGSAASYGPGRDGAADPVGFAARVAGADAFLHVQDHAETDLLDGPDHAAHEGGFAAAAAVLGAEPALYHADLTTAGAPRMRLLADELARVVRGRAANPDWIAGQRRHGRRGAAELARTLDSLHGFAVTLSTRLDRQFDLYFAATLGDAATEAFLRAENPAAHAAMRARFADALRRDLWRPRRNAVFSILEAA